MSKINKEFVLSDSSVNTYGFRLLTSGYQIKEFEKNPIGFYMHLRENGVLIKWTDLKIVGDKIIGTPIINDENDRAQRTIDEVTNGFLNAASMGQFVVLEKSDDPALKLKGQTGPTVTKWYNRECSLVDVPGNISALVLYDNSNTEISLMQLMSLSSPTVAIAATSVDKKSLDEMLSTAVKDKDITPEMSIVLKRNYADKVYALPDLLKAYTNMRIKHLVSQGFTALDRSGDLQELKDKSQLDYDKLFFEKFGKYPNQNPSGKSANEKMLQYAVDNKDITPEHAVGIKWNTQNDPERMPSMIDAAKKANIESLMDRTWEDLDKNDLLQQLKDKNLQGFKAKYRQKFGMEYKGK